VAPDRSKKVRGTISFVVVLISLPRDQNAQTKFKSKSQEPRAIERRLTAKGIHRSSQPSRLVFRSPSSYYTAFPTVVICQVFYYIYVVSISARSTLEYSELKDDPYLTQTALQYTLHSFDSQYLDINIWITFCSTRLPSCRNITTLLSTTLLEHHDLSLFTMSSACAYRDGNTVSLPSPCRLCTRSIGGKRDIS
jgi:hypothetical protein